jgi:NAD(P)H-dependent FMN reductase
MKLLVVLASVRKGRAGEKVAHWFVERVKEDGRFEPELVDKKSLNSPTSFLQRCPQQ